MAIIPIEGEVLETRQLVALDPSPDLWVLLFTGPSAVDRSTVYADIVEVTAFECPGYGRVAVSGLTITITDLGFFCTATFSTVSFVIGANPGTAVILGYAVIDLATIATIKWVNLFSSSIAVPALGITIDVDIVYTHKQCP